MLHVVPDVWGMLLERVLRFFQRGRTRNSAKERDPRWLSLTQAVRSKLIPTSLALILGIKTRSLKVFSQYPLFHLWLSTQKRGCQVWQGCPKDSAQLTQIGVWILVSLGEYPRAHIKGHTRYDQGLQRSTVSQGECRSHSAMLSWLDA